MQQSPPTRNPDSLVGQISLDNLVSEPAQNPPVQAPAPANTNRPGAADFTQVPCNPLPTSQGRVQQLKTLASIFIFYASKGVRSDQRADWPSQSEVSHDSLIQCTSHCQLIPAAQTFQFDGIARTGSFGDQNNADDFYDYENETRGQPPPFSQGNHHRKDEDDLRAVIKFH